MTVILELPAATKARLEAEAARRGITLDQLVADLAARLPDQAAEASSATLEDFFGSGDSGDPAWATTDLHELRHELAQRRSSERS